MTYVHGQFTCSLIPRLSCLLTVWVIMMDSVHTYLPSFLSWHHALTWDYVYQATASNGNWVGPRNKATLRQYLLVVIKHLSMWAVVHYGSQVSLSPSLRHKLFIVLFTYMGRTQWGEGDPRADCHRSILHQQLLTAGWTTCNEAGIIGIL